MIPSTSSSSPGSSTTCSILSTGLAIVRGLVRDGGICLVESAAVLEDTTTMHFNSFGRFTAGGRRSRGDGPIEGMQPGSATCHWFVTPRCLDYVLRILRLSRSTSSTSDRRARWTASRRRAGSPSPAARWRSRSANRRRVDQGQQLQSRFGEFLDWDEVASDLREVGYDGSREGLVRGDAGSIDVHASVEATEPLRSSAS